MTDPALFAEEKHLRLPGYDYGQEGAYFITIATKDRIRLFGSKTENGEPPYVVLNGFGRIASNAWEATTAVRTGISLGPWVVMPDHMHGILIIDSATSTKSRNALGRVGEAGNNQAPSRTVNAIVRGYKGAVTTAINTIRNTPGAPVWRANFYEHIIRSDAAFHRISQYILNNPKKLVDRTGM